MVDDTQNYWGFRLFLSSGILGNRGHGISDGPVIEISTFQGAQLSRCLPFSPEDGKISSFRNVVLYIT
jgi:hypothetical protein